MEGQLSKSNNKTDNHNEYHQLVEETDNHHECHQLVGETQITEVAFKDSNLEKDKQKIKEEFLIFVPTVSLKVCTSKELDNGRIVVNDKMNCHR